MKTINSLLLVACLSLSFVSTASSQDFIVNTARSQINLGDFGQNGNGSNVFINYIKTTTGFGAAGAQLSPTLLDQNGNPLATIGSLGPAVGWFQPQPAERPGHHVATAAGMGDILLGSRDPGPQNGANASCTGTSSGTWDCSNTACTGMAGYISGTTLTITTGPGGGCTLAVGQPVTMSSGIASGTYNSTTGAVSLTLSRSDGVGVGVKVIVASIGTGALGAVQNLNGTFTTTTGTGGTTLNFTAPTGLCADTAMSCVSNVFTIVDGDVESTVVNTLGVETRIAGMSGSANCLTCTGTGGTGTYLVNFSQTVGSAGSPVALTPGIRMEWYTVGYDASVGEDEFVYIIKSTTAGDRIRWPANYHVNDESDYVSQSLTPLGTLTQAAFRAFYKPLNIAVLRDLAWIYTGTIDNTITTWSTTRSPRYVAYSGAEPRPNVYAGTPSYTFSGTTHCPSGVNCFTMNWWANASSAPTDHETLIITLPSNALQGGTALQQVNVTGTGSGLTDGNYTNVSIATVSGSGTGAVASVVDVNGGQVVYVALMGGDPEGTGYAIGDHLSLVLGGQTITMTVSSVGYDARLSVDNGATYFPILPFTGQPLNPFFTYLPVNTIMAFSFDGDLQAWLSASDGPNTDAGGITNGGPSEAFIQVCAELGISPWSVAPVHTLDSQTDYQSQYAAYIKANYPWMVPRFEGPNETWNTNGANWYFMSSKATLWSKKGAPLSWYETVPIGYGFSNDEYGKMASTLGQSVSAVLGANFQLIVGVQTATGTSTFQTNISANRIVSNAYVNQTFAAQSGFSKTPAYTYAPRIAVTNYWQPDISVGLARTNNTGAIGETSLGYQYFVGNTATRSSLMTTYAGYGQAFIGMNQAWYTFWDAFATSCGGTSLCSLGGLEAYEGGNTGGNHGSFGMAQGQETSQPVSGATDTTQCILKLGPLPIDAQGDTSFTGNISGTTLTPTNSPSFDPPTQGSFSPGMLLSGTGVTANTQIVAYTSDPNQGTMTVSPSQTASFSNGQIYGSGAVVGMATLALSNVVNGSGGTWSTSAGAYQNLIVGAVGNGSIPPTITISNLDCSGLGALASATLTYKGSANWVNTMRVQSYQYPQIGNVDAVDFQNFVNAGGRNPSQLNDVGGASANTNNLNLGQFPWLIGAFDSYGWWPDANCTACNVGSPDTTHITLGGTVTGQFKVGDSLLGKGVASLQTTSANTTITGCTLGSGMSAPCGTNPTDVLTLSQIVQSTQSSVSVGAYNFTPAAAYTAIKSWN